MADVLAPTNLHQSLACLASRQRLLPLISCELQFATEPNVSSLCSLATFIGSALFINAS